MAYQNSRGRGRGRGRGAGFKAADFTSMALDYDSKMNSKATPLTPRAVSPSAGSGPATAEASSSATLARPRHNFRPFQPKHFNNGRTSDPPSRTASPASNLPFVRQPLRSGIGSHQSGNRTIAPSFPFNRTRQPDSMSHDPALTKPITFVKAFRGLDSTMDKEEHDLYLKEQVLGNLLSSSPIMSASTSLPVNALIKVPSHESTSSASSGASKPLSPHAAPFQKSTFLGSFKPQFSPKPVSSPLDKGKGKAPAPMETEGEMLFMIDTAGGERPDSAAVKVAIPEREIRLPIPSPQQITALDDDDSETEDVYPVGKQAVADDAAPYLSPSILQRQSHNTAIMPYARTIADPVDFARIFRPFAPTQPSAECQDLSLKATQVNGDDAKLPSKKAVKKQVKREVKERKRERNRPRGPQFEYVKARSAKKEKKVPRLDDSDIEWGSDGPPAHMLKDDYEQAEQEMMGLDIQDIPGHKARRSNERNTAKSRKKRDEEEAMEDFIANLAAQKDSDEEQSKNVIGMEAFVASMRGEHLTIDDIQDIHDHAMESSEGSTVISDDDDESEGIMAAETVKIIKEVEEKFPIYIPQMLDRDSDLDSEGRKIFKSDDENDLLDNPELLSKWAEDGKDFIKKQKRSGASSTSSSASSGSDEDEEVANAPIEGENVLIATTDDDDDSEDEEDEDEEEEDLMQLYTKPAGKKSKLPPSFDNDFFDDLLQTQWLKDKQKKALFKQDRALKRLQQAPTKSNKKKAKRASTKAKAYDLDDDFAVNGADFEIAALPEFHKINQDLRDFITNSGHAQYPLPPMDKKFRYAIHMLADAYNLKSKSKGAGRDRHPVLYRTQHTSVHLANNKKIQKFLSITSTWSSGGNKTFSYERTRVGGGKSAPAPASRNHEGAVVGQGAEKIASDNIGHQMLAKMGWAEGMVIGRTGGLREPLDAIVKTSKAGLGSGWIRYNRGSGQLTPVPAVA